VTIPSIPAALPKRRPLYAHLYVQVLCAIVLGAVVGHAWPGVGEALRPLGDGFIKLVKYGTASVALIVILMAIFLT